MTVRLPRKIRRILMALHHTGLPLTGAQLCRITCHWPGTVYPALDRLERNGWIERATDRAKIPGYRLTDHGRRGAGLALKETP